MLIQLKWVMTPYYYRESTESNAVNNFQISKKVQYVVAKKNLVNEVLEV